MTVTYFKRYRMQYDLRNGCVCADPMPEGYEILPWNSELLAGHAEAKYRSFRNELDSHVFPCLGDSDGCYRLMKEISCRQGFVPQATWLITYRHNGSKRIDNCGTIQGIREQAEVGSIQNVGIAPSHRGCGLGSMLVSRALLGFQSVGIKFVTLEVTAQNVRAVQLYQRLGFRTQRTVFKSVEVVYS